MFLKSVFVSLNFQQLKEEHACDGKKNMFCERVAHVDPLFTGFSLPTVFWNFMVVGSLQYIFLYRNVDVI